MLLLANPRTVLAASLLFSGMTLATCPEVVPLQQGVDNLALVHAKSDDFAVLATFENNTSHPNRGLSFYIKTQEALLQIVGGGRLIVPFC